jgi:hypothetical protein
VRVKSQMGKWQIAKPAEDQGPATGSCFAICLFALCSLSSPALAATPGAPSAQPLPLDDPQFWVVTLAALCAGSWILRKLLPAALFTRRRKRAGKRATLTVGGKPVSAKPKRQCH